MTLSEWKGLVITQEVMHELERRIQEQTDLLITSAGHDPRLDSFRSGVIAALKDVVSFQFDEEPQID